MWPDLVFQPECCIQSLSCRCRFIWPCLLCIFELLSDGFQDPKDFVIAYEDMLDFLQDERNWVSMEQELSLKGVKAMTFYDVVLDYILMDAFEDLESPPSSVTAVVQNRWLSNGFKETVCTSGYL